MEYRRRTYRKLVKGKGTISFPISLKDSDLLISVDRESFSPDLKKKAMSVLLEIRSDLENYIAGSVSRKSPSIIQSLRTWAICRAFK
jgi:hypothetical protein